MSKDAGFKQLIGKHVSKVKVTETSVLLKTEDTAYHIWVQDGKLMCTEDSKTTRKLLLEAHNLKTWPFPQTPQTTEDKSLD